MKKKTINIETERAARHAEKALLDGTAEIVTIVNQRNRKSRVTIEVRAYGAAIYRAPFSALWKKRNPLTGIKKSLKALKKAVR